jgi:hypothetical protein
MKKIYILTLALCAFAFTTNAQADYEEDYEFFNLGDISPQHPLWRTWGFPSGAGEDGQVVDTQSASGDKSLEINEVGAPAGIDLIMYVSGAPTTGVYSLQWNMLIPDGREGYFNMQAEVTPEGTPWNQYLNGGNVYFNEAGGDPGVGNIDGTPGQTFAFPHDQWFRVDCVYDLDAQTWAMYIDGVEQFNDQSFTFNDPFVELAAIDFYAPSSSTLYYVDDMLHYNGDSSTLGTNDFSANAFSVYPNPVTDILNIRSQSEVSSVTVYDVLGKVILQAQPNSISPSIDMSTLASGAYLIQVTIGSTTKTVKVIK